MIKHSDYGLVPSHGELLRKLPVKKLSDTVYITKSSGIFAGDEILDIVHGKYHEFKNTSLHKVCTSIA